MFFYQQPYKQEVLHYKLVNSDCIEGAIKNFVKILFNEIILNIICNLISPKIITCDDSDLPWMIKLIKKRLMVKVYVISALWKIKISPVMIVI